MGQASRRALADRNVARARSRRQQQQAAQAKLRSLRRAADGACIWSLSGRRHPRSSSSSTVATESSSNRQKRQRRYRRRRPCSTLCGSLVWRATRWLSTKTLWWQHGPPAGQVGAGGCAAAHPAAQRGLHLLWFAGSQTGAVLSTVLTLPLFSLPAACSALRPPPACQPVAASRNGASAAGGTAAAAAGAAGRWGRGEGGSWAACRLAAGHADQQQGRLPTRQAGCTSA